MAESHRAHLEMLDSRRNTPQPPSSVPASPVTEISSPHLPGFGQPFDPKYTTLRNLPDTQVSSFEPADHDKTGDVVARFERAYRQPPSSHSHSHSHGSCCSGSHEHDVELWLKESGAEHGSSRLSDADIERGPPNYQRFVLNIDGLKCGCCEGGITRAVIRVAAIRDHQLNGVMARLEFDLDINLTSIDEVIKRLNSATGYTFEQNSKPVGQVLEFTHTGTHDFHRSNRPEGITAIELPDPHRQFWNTSWNWTRDNLLSSNTSDTQDKERAKAAIDKCIMATRPSQLVRVHYDANVIGARDIYNHYVSKNDQITLAPPPAHPSLQLGSKQTRQALFWFLPASVLTVPVVVFAWAPIDHDKLSYAHASVALASIVQIIAWVEFLPGAVRSLWYSLVLDMDFLITLSTTTAYVFSVISYAYQTLGKTLESGSFFETSTLLVALILLGRVMNEFARYRAAKSVSFRSLQIDKTLLVECGHEREADPPTKEIDARLLQYGDSFKVLPHTRIVTDGEIYYGGSEVDESMLTGESIPVAKGVQSRVYAGTMNGSGTLIVLLKNLPHENYVHKIATMVESAELTQPKIQALADRIAGWFVPVIAAFGSLVFLIWLLVDRYHNKHAWQDVVVKAITYAIATLIVSCPCAIGLAVPMVVLIAGGVAARYGIIFRDPQKLEVACNVTDVVFDKTGTLTTGYFSVIHEKYHGSMEPNQIRSILLGLLKDSKHPISSGAYAHLSKASRAGPGPDIVPGEFLNITSHPGEGIRGLTRIGGYEVRAGSAEWVGCTVQEASASFLCVTIQGELAATFTLRDTPKRNAEEIISALHKRHITVHMISGDSQGAVDAIAHELNIPKRFTKSRCRPEGKMQYIQDLQTQEGKRKSKVVLFVGDGTNDSIALEQANVGCHMNSPHGENDVAKHAADVVLMTSRLGDILILLDISRAAYRRILLNFAWSAVYYVVAVLMAAGAFSSLGNGKGVRIPPQWAGLGELVSVLPVVGVAFQMRWRDYGNKFRGEEDDGEGEKRG